MAHVVVADLLERRETAPGGEKSGRVRIASGARLVSHLKRELAEVASHRLTGRDAKVREPIEVVENVLASVVVRAARQVPHVADVRMRIDQRGDHGLARKIDTHGTRGCHRLALATHSDEASILHEKGGAFDRCPAISGYQPGSLI